MIFFFNSCSILFSFCRGLKACLALLWIRRSLMSIISACKVYHILFKHCSITSEMVSINVWYLKARFNKGCRHLLSMAFSDGRTLQDSWEKTIEWPTQRSAQLHSEQLDKLVKVTVTISVSESSVPLLSFIKREKRCAFVFPDRARIPCFLVNRGNMSSLSVPALLLREVRP